MDRGPLGAVSPLDGRYASYTEALVPYASEQALMRARLRVEVEYLLALADLEATPIAIPEEQRDRLRACYQEFDERDARRIKRLETEGDGDRPATNHDVKAVEYFLRDQLESVGGEWVHFGLTSEDITNLAYRLLVGPAVVEVLVPRIRDLRDELSEMAHEYRDTPMLARTHGQPATPTTFGKECAVYATRLGRTVGELERAADGLAGKLGGASGTYAAHHAAYPEVDWPSFARSFVTGLGLEHEPVTTQVNPCDDLAALFDALRRVNHVLLDLSLDVWLYVSRGYLGQRAVEGETGSSTMPHKVNPIDFENAEGNLSKANSDLVFLGSYLTRSRLQRDLSDSTVKRNLGGALAHCLVAYGKLDAGLGKVVPNETTMREQLEAHPEIIGEAVQTILRREGDEEAYERIKALTRGQEVTLADFLELFGDLDVDPEVRTRLEALTPTGYTGHGADLADLAGDPGGTNDNGGESDPEVGEHADSADAEAGGNTDSTESGAGEGSSRDGG